MAICLQPYLIGVAHRIACLDSALAYIRSHDRVWFATGEEIVRYWLQIGRNLLTGRAPLFCYRPVGGNWRASLPRRSGPCGMPRPEVNLLLQAVDAAYLGKR
jgi:hypothetical protein